MATLQTQTSQELRTALLPIDLYEREDALLLLASLPGVRAEDLDIQLEGDRLTLTAERREPAPHGDDSTLADTASDTASDTAADAAADLAADTAAAPLFRELGGVRWTRQVHLRTPVDADQVQAHLEHGLLRLTLPKAPQARPRTIPVKAG